MGFSPLRTPRRPFGTRYSVFPLLAAVRAEADAKRDLARMMRRPADAREARTRIRPGRLL